MSSSAAKSQEVLESALEDQLAKAEAEVSRLRELQRAAKQLRLDSVKPIYSYILEPVTDRFDKVLVDPIEGDGTDACLLYHLRGVPQNAEELEAVGKRVSSYSARYLFSNLHERFLIAVGGGSFNHAMQSSDCMRELSAFVMSYPEGGDVSEIVRKYENA